MRAGLITASIAILAACNNSSVTQSGEPSGPIRSGEPAANDSANVAANVAAETEAGNTGELPPPGEGPRFVGKWAADQRSCQSAAWQFTDTTLRTPAGASCAFNRVTEVPGGYDVQATCTAEAAPSADVLKIRFAESAKAMLFESKSIANTGLVFCGRDV